MVYHVGDHDHHQDEDDISGEAASCCDQPSYVCVWSDVTIADSGDSKNEDPHRIGYFVELVIAAGILGPDTPFKNLHCESENHGT